MEKEYQVNMQNSLKELQTNLKDLESARAQINQAKNAALKVVSGMDGIQMEYASHLKSVSDQIDDLQSKYDAHLDSISQQMERFLERSEKQLQEQFEENMESMKGASGDLLNLNQQNTSSSKNLLDKTAKDLLKLHDDQAIGHKALIEKLQDEQKVNFERISSINEGHIGKLAETIEQVKAFFQVSEQQMQEHLEAGLKQLSETSQGIENRQTDNAQSQELLLKETSSKIMLDFEAYIKRNRDLMEQTSKQMLHTHELHSLTNKALIEEASTYVNKLLESSTASNLEVIKTINHRVEDNFESYNLRSRDLLNDLIEQNRKHLTFLQDELKVLKAYIQEDTDINYQRLTDYQESISGALQVSIGKLDLQVEESRQQHEVHTIRLETYLGKHEALIEKVEKLDRNIDTVDFPQRLLILENKIQENQDVFQQKLQSMEQQHSLQLKANSDNQLKEIRNLKWLNLGMIVVVLILMMYFVFS